MWLEVSTSLVALMTSKSDVPKGHENFRSFPAKGEKKIMFLSQRNHPSGYDPSPDPAYAGCFVHRAALTQRNQLQKNSVKLVAYAVFLARLFSFLAGFSNASYFACLAAYEDGEELSHT